MQDKGGRHRLAIAVVPRLLGETLSRALARDDLDIVVIDEAGEISADVDIVLVSADVEARGIGAGTILRLPDPEAADSGDGSTAGLGSVTTVGGSRPADLRQLTGITRMIDRLMRVG